MKLHITSTKIDNDLVLDSEQLCMDNCCVMTGEALFAKLLQRVCYWVTMQGGALSDVYCDTFDGDEEEDFDLGMAAGGGFFERLRDVALLIWYLKNGKATQIDEAQVFAVIENQGLKWFDFESIKSEVEDNCLGEYPDDVEEWAIEYLRETGQSLPDGLESYFDYEQFGQDMLRDNYSEVEWNGNTYLYSN